MDSKKSDVTIFENKKQDIQQYYRSINLALFPGRLKNQLIHNWINKKINGHIINATQHEIMGNRYCETT